MSDSIAARVYAAYTASLGVDLPKLMDRSDKGAPWFAVVNARAQIVAEPTDVSEPSAFELSNPIAQRRICDLPGGNESTEIFMEKIPTSLAIRPLVAGDLCQRGDIDSNPRYWHEIVASVHEVDPDMLEWRVDLADAQAADQLVVNADGLDAGGIMREIYIDAGGDRLNDGNAWTAAANALLTVDNGETFTVTCRTPGLGDLTVGPLRPGHMIIQKEVEARSSDWDGRIAVLAKTTGAEIEHLRAARIEDAMRLWECVESLKKKAEERKQLRLVVRPSTNSTHPGPEQKSTV